MDDINITYPNVGTLYESDSNGMQVQWNYQSQSNAVQSLSWAYKLDGGSYPSLVSGTDSVSGSTWLSNISADGQTHTLYVALLDGSGNALTEDQHIFTYNTGSKYKSQSTLMVNQENSNTGIPGAVSGTWYQSFKAVFDSKLHKFAFVTNGVFDANATVTIREGVGTNGTILHTGTWTGIGTNTNDYNEYTPDEDVVLTLDQNYTIQLQNQTSGGFIGHNTNQYDDGMFYYSGYSGEYGDLKMKIWSFEENPIPSSISIKYPNYVGSLYASESNEMQVQWNYQSQSNAIQSLSWAYKLDGGNYSSPVSGTDSVSGSNWLNGLSYGNHTLYVALLDQGNSNNVLSTDSHSFSYQSGGSGSQSGGGGYQSGGGGYQSPDSVHISYPNVGSLYASESNEMQVQWNYQSQSNAIQSLSWAYKLDGGNYSSPVSGTDSVSGSNWLNGLSYGNHTLYVALLDQGNSNNVLSTDSHSFSYQSGGSGSQSGGGGYQSGGGGYQSPDSVHISYPNVGSLYASESNEMQVQWNYQSQSNAIQSLSWAYKLDGGNYSSPVSGTDSVSGSNWLNGLSYGNHTLYVALLDQGNSNNVLSSDSHSFSYQSGGSGSQSGGGGYQSGGGGYQSPDSVHISYPNVGSLYASESNEMQVQWNYQSQSNAIQSLSWAYKLDGGNYSSPVSGTDSVSGSNWLNGLSYGNHTLYVALLDQGNSNNVLSSDSHSFSYQSGGSGSQSGGGGYQSGGGGYQSPDSVHISYPNVGSLYASESNEMQVQWNYQSQSNAIQSLSWAYKLDGGNYSSPVSGTDSVSGSNWLNGLSYGNHTLYVALLDQGNSNNVLSSDSHSFSYQSGGSGSQSGGGGYQSGGGGYQSPDSVHISYPNVGSLYASESNEMQVQWNYQSQSNAIQSLSWAYKLDGGNYSSPVSGTDSVSGSNWLNGLSYGNHTLYVALLDQGNSNNVLSSDSHSFSYQSGGSGSQSGGGGYQSGDDGYQSDDGGTQSGDSGYQSPGDGYQSDTSGYNLINITYPTIYNVSDWNSLEIEWTYASGVANQSSPRFGYSIDENITSQGVYINEFNAFNVYGSEWLAGLSDGEHTVYVALLDATNGSILASDSHLFSLTSSSDPQDPGTSNDDITIINPGSGSVIERNATLTVDLSYASEVSSSESPRWAYKINEDFYSTQTSAIEVNSTSVHGWLDDLEDGEHTVYVALLMTYGGDYILAEDNVTFELVGEDDGVPPYFNFTDSDLSQITGRTDLAEGNYTILKDHNSTDSSYFKIAPVYRDENDYILVEIESAVSSSIDFASLQSYLDDNFFEEVGFVDFMPFDFHPIDRIDLNNSSELAALSNGYDEIFFQEYTPREWYTYDEFNESSLNASLWDIAYFAGGLAPTHLNGKAVLSGNQSTGNNPHNIPSILEIPDLSSGQGNSALFLDDTEAFGIELDVTIPSTGNSQEVGFFIDLIDVNLTHHEIIELAWRSDGTAWNWEETSDANNQTIYRSLEAEIDQTYAVSIIQNGHYTQVFIDEKMIAKISGHFSARAWLIGAFNDNGEPFEASIDNVRVLKKASQVTHLDRYWALSIEGDAQNLDMVVDMAGYVYRGNFEDYWYNLFQLPAYNPKFDEEIPHRDWHEVFYKLSNSNINNFYSDFPVIREKQLFFTDTEFSLTENNDINASVGHILLSIPELLGDLSYTVTTTDHTSQPISASINQNGLITIPGSIDYEIQTEISLGVSVVDEFGRGFTESITISIDDVFEDLDGDGEEDHLDTDIDGDSFDNQEEESYGFDPRNAYSHPELPIVQTLSAELSSNGTYFLKGTLLSKGGVSLNDLGFEINGKGFNENERIAVDINTSEGSVYSIQLLNPAPGETFTYRAFAVNVAGKTTGAPRKIKTKISEDWWYGADELEGGWKSSWIGVFLPQPNEWAYHAELGWAFVSPDGSGGLWLWVEENGWHWTREGVWPFLWSNNTADWLYLMKSGSRVFLYDYSTQSFISDF